MVVNTIRTVYKTDKIIPDSTPIFIRTHDLHTLLVEWMSILLKFTIILESQDRLNYDRDRI